MADTGSDDPAPTVRVSLGSHVEDLSDVFGPDEVTEWFPPQEPGDPVPQATSWTEVFDDPSSPLRAVAEGTVRPSFGRFLILAGEFSDSSPYDDDLDLTAPFNVGSSWISVESAGSDHRAGVRLELWNAPPVVDPTWGEAFETRVTCEGGDLEVTDFEAVERDAVTLSLQPHTDLGVRIQSRGGADVAAAEEEAFARLRSMPADADLGGFAWPSGVEQWRVQLWPWQVATGWLPDGWDLDRIRGVAGGSEFEFGDPARLVVHDESGRRVDVDSVLLHADVAIVHEVGDDDEWSVGALGGVGVRLWATYGSLDAALRGL